MLIHQILNLRSNYQKIAFQVFHKEGVLGLLPLPGNQYNLVWSLDPHLYEQLISTTDTEFLKELNDHLSTQIPPNPDFFHPPMIEKLVSRKIGFPLQTSNLENYIQKNIVFIGDSAHTIHPMLGQGLNLGIADASDLTHHLTNNLKYGLALNDPRELDSFGKQARWRNYRLQTAVEALKIGYGAENISTLRDLTINSLNTNQTIKSILEDLVN